ncbi:hypothetical protein L873DRAFT_330808 [Choiromyces venosus 120613-1]|uniref:Uncharacterized protein n=1 Tax=Choiromyces venosus 120613-1 TaxID=1336337 RepID=A0A3N4JX92_9PEZI|nr:hypothetical protein L873DRAFT_330808 [Choiromyces venosus 120613-1]
MMLNKPVGIWSLRIMRLPPNIKFHSRVKSRQVFAPLGVTNIINAEKESVIAMGLKICKCSTLPPLILLKRAEYLISRSGIRRCGNSIS